MKKLLAALLAGLMLMGFGAGVNAQTPEELQAEGRALLAQTMEDLRGSYTIEGRLSFRETRGDYVGVAHGGGAYAFIREDGVLDLHLEGKALRVYPDRNAYHALSLSYSFNYLPLLTPRQIPENIAVRSWYGSIEVSLGGMRCWYKNGSLWSVDDDASYDIAIALFTKSADASMFSLEGMREVPGLMQWVWEPQEALGIFLDEHPAFNTIFGKALSAAVTALVLVCLPLLSLAVILMRVLFYFDIYKA